MLGRRPDQGSFFEADTQYIDCVGKDSFYGFLAGLRGQLFRDEEFASFYDKEGRGRPSVPPSLLATALLLQTFDRVSDEEAKQRADFDLRWKVALGISIDCQPFAKSTLQLFRAQLVVHDEARKLFQKSLQLARAKGFMTRNRKLRLALDTTNILGRGAVKDTYNLLADGIVLVLRQFAQIAGSDLAGAALKRGLERYVSGRSIKGEAALNWDDAKERARLLREIVAAGDKLLVEVREQRAVLGEGAQSEALKEAAERLSQVLLQDIERKEDGASLREGVAKDRMPSVHDPEMRHGHKSAHKLFNGHKGQIAVDTETQLITSVAVLAGNAADSSGALALVEAAEKNCEAEAAESVADCAFGDGTTRQAFAEAGRRLVAKVPVTRNGDRFPKTAFTIDLATESCVCPAGQTGIACYSRQHKLRSFRFDPATCLACPLQAQCLRSKSGRSIAVHPQEALLQEARAFQQSAAFAPYRHDRQAVEHRIARLVQLVIRQARYVGRAKTLFQLLMAATVANLTLLANAGNTRSAQNEQFLLAGTLVIAVAALIALAIVPELAISPRRPSLGRSARTPTRPASQPASAHPLAKMAYSRPRF